MEDALKKAEQEIKRLNRKLDRANKELKNFSALYDAAVRLRDFSEREKKRQFEYNYLLMQNANDMIFILDEKLRFKICTASLLGFLGKESVDDMVDKRPEECFKGVISDEKIKRFVARLEEVLTTGKPFVALDRIEFEAGELFFSVDLTPAIAPDGTVRGVVAQVHDSTKLVKMTEDAQTATKAKSAFLASISHEIRTPLNAVIGMAELAKRKTHDSATGGMISEILSASKHLLGLINDVLDFSNIESGKFDLAREPFKLRDAMREIADIFAHRSEEAGVDLSHNVDSIRDITVVGDEMHIKQVLINLLGNAIKFTPRGGSVRFTVEEEVAGEQIATMKFTIADTGIGMTEEQRSSLFEAFSQADASITKKFGCTGLGLAISQGIVSAMGGTIEIESEFGRGSSFSFKIPFHVADEARSTGGSADDMPDLAGHRILVVDDLEINRMILCELLEMTGAEVEEAEDGSNAIDLFERSEIGRYSLIFMDIQMPNVDGYAATEKIRALERDDASKIPIVAMTANAYSEDVERAIKSGMNAHLSKPIEMDRLTAYLRKTFDA